MNKGTGADAHRRGAAAADPNTPATAGRAQPSCHPSLPHLQLALLVSHVGSKAAAMVLRLAAVGQARRRPLGGGGRQARPHWVAPAHDRGGYVERLRCLAAHGHAGRVTSPIEKPPQRCRAAGWWRQPPPGSSLPPALHDLWRCGTVV